MLGLAKAESGPQRLLHGPVARRKVPVQETDDRATRNPIGRPLDLARGR
jgi:hypothetical protein